jgi:lactate racemase
MADKNYKFKYGKQFVKIDLPEKAEHLTIQEPEFSINQDKFIKDLSSKLPDNLSNCQAPSFIASIIVADKTRLCDYKIYLPWVLDTLHSKNIQKHQIQFFIAYGTHTKQSDEECSNSYGETYKNYKFIHHDCSDKSLFTYLGKTTKGTTIHVRKDILESDLIITFGALSHHYFAGYGGGRKLLFPGLGYMPDIYQNHKLFLNKISKKLETGCQPGNLENNPLADDLKQIDAAVCVERVAIHGILDSKARVHQLIVGKTYNDFLNACNTLDSFYKTMDKRKNQLEYTTQYTTRREKRVKKQYKLVIASCGGFPKDINFIQAHKAIHNAAMFVKESGILIMIAQCPDGIGSDAFLEYFDYKNFNLAFKHLENNYKGNGGTALSMMYKALKINIFIKTSLNGKTCKKIGMQKIEMTMIQTMIEEFQDDMAVINNASLLIF